MPDRPKLNLAPVTAPSNAPAASSPATAPRAPRQRSTTRRDPAQDTETRRAPRASAPQPARVPAPSQSSVPARWREWGPFHQAVSFKWPAELVAELDDRRHDMREPVGLMVVAAVAHLLDQDDDTIRALLDRAEHAKPRRARGAQR